MPSFYERVERLCRKLTANMPAGRDRDAIDDLADEAADMQGVSEKDVVQVLNGIADEIRE